MSNERGKTRAPARDLATALADAEARKTTVYSLAEAVVRTWEKSQKEFRGEEGVSTDFIDAMDELAAALR